MNQEKDIRLDVDVKPSVVNKPYANMLGPVYRTKALYKGSKVDVVLTPFVNIGQWFRPANRNRKRMQICLLMVSGCIKNR